MENIEGAANGQVFWYGEIPGIYRVLEEDKGSWHLVPFFSFEELKSFDKICTFVLIFPIESLLPDFLKAGEAQKFLSPRKTFILAYGLPPTSNQILEGIQKGVDSFLLPELSAPQLAQEIQHQLYHLTQEDKRAIPCHSPFCSTCFSTKGLYALYRLYQLIKDKKGELEAQEKLLAHQNTRIEKKQKEIYREKSLHQKILESINGGYLLLDRQGNLIEGSPRGFQILHELGYQKGPLVQLGELAWEDILSSQESSFQLEKKGRFWEGEVHFLEDEVLLFLKDITKRVKKERLIEQKQRMASLGILSAGMAHDFNNLLQGILGQAEMLLLESDYKEQDSTLKERLQNIMDLGEQATLLVQEILDFAQEIPVQKEPLSLRKIIESLLPLIQSSLPKDILVETHFLNKEDKILGNRSKIQQLLINLLLNSRDALSGKGKIWIILDSAEPKLEKEESSEQKEWLCLEVRDNGKGMDQETLEHIFEPFFTTKPRGQGTGLGLAQVFGIMKFHNGHIEVESEPGEGTRFRLYFPLISEKAKKRKITSGEEKLNQKGILLVEDHPILLQLGEAAFRQEGFWVWGAKDKKTGFRLFQENREKIHCLVLDYNLSDGTGLELLDQILAANPSQNLVTIMVTGIHLDDVKEECRKRGIDYIQKPFSYKELIHKIENLIQN